MAYTRIVERIVDLLNKEHQFYSDAEHHNEENTDHFVCQCGLLKSGKWKIIEGENKHHHNPGVYKERNIIPDSFTINRDGQGHVSLSLTLPKIQAECMTIENIENENIITLSRRKDEQDYDIITTMSIVTVGREAEFEMHQYTEITRGKTILEELWSISAICET